MTSADASWITRLGEGTAGLRVGVKDLIDVIGVPTTAGCRAVADTASPATADAVCLAGTRAAVEGGRAILVGKANLHELADGISGINPWFGTPVNPIDPARVPGGSSSGSATAVGSDEVDLAIGTDTAGSVRIPAACCGIAGLKTSWGRVAPGGVWPLAPTLDTIGPLARDIAGLVTGMGLLDPTFVLGAALDGPIARLRATSADGRPLRAAPAVEAAIEAALSATGLDVVDVAVPGWVDAARAALQIIGAEASALHGPLVRRHPEGVGADVRAALEHGGRIGHQALRQSRSLASRWRAKLDRDLFGRYAALACPVLDDVAPLLDGDLGSGLTLLWTAPVSLAGAPALALPIPAGPGGARRGGGGRAGVGRAGASRYGPPLPLSLQLVGPAGSEGGLLGLGAQVEAAVANLWRQ